MSIENANRIDFISTGKTNGIINLTLVDPLDWTNEGRHLLLLQDKINAYLRFIENGELEEKYPAAKGRRCSINIVAKHKPNEAGLKFLGLVRKLVENAGYGFNHEVRNDLTAQEE